MRRYPSPYLIFHGYLKYFIIENVNRRAEMVKSKSKLSTKTSLSFDNVESEMERCLNPWNGDCKSTDIAIYIMYKGNKIPLCWKCWRKISKKNLEWEAY